MQGKFQSLAQPQRRPPQSNGNNEARDIFPESVKTPTRSARRRWWGREICQNGTENLAWHQALVTGKVRIRMNLVSGDPGETRPSDLHTRSPRGRIREKAPSLCVTGGNPLLVPPWLGHERGGRRLWYGEQVDVEGGGRTARASGSTEHDAADPAAWRSDPHTARFDPLVILS